MSFLFQRIFSAGIIYTCTLYIAYILGAEAFGEIAFLLFLTKFMHIINFGSVSGYLHKTYNSDELKIENYTLFYLLHLVCISLIIITAILTACPNTVCSNDLYHWSVIFFIIQIPLYAIEPNARVNKHFYISLLPELLLLLSFASSVLLLGSSKQSDLNNIFGTTMAILTFLAVIVITIYFRTICKLEFMQIFHFVRDAKSYAKIVKKGFPLYTGTMLFLLFLFIDRFFIQNYHSAELLGVYMMAFNFAMVSSLIIGSLNFTNVIKLGEAIKSGTLDKGDMLRDLKMLLSSGIALYFVIILASSVAEMTLLKDYTQLTFHVAALSFGFICFYIAGNFSPILFFKNKQYLITRAMAIIVIISIISNIILIVRNTSEIYISLITALLLVIFSIYSLVCSFSKPFLYSAK